MTADSDGFPDPSDNEPDPRRTGSRPSRRSKPEPSSFRLNCPAHMTEGGGAALREHVRSLYRPLVAELDRRAAEQRASSGARPEHTAQTVREVISDIALLERTTGRDFGALGTVAVTVGSVGLGAMTPYLHSPWQWALFAALGAVGASGLAGTWWSRNSGRNRAD